MDNRGPGAGRWSPSPQVSRVADVHAVARKRHADAVRERGLLMTGIWGEGAYRFSCSEDLPDAWLDADYYIITAKSTDTEAVCRQFAGAIRGHEVVSLQNGIGNEEIIGRFTDRVIGGMIITGFECRADASVHVSVEPEPMKLGRFPFGMDARSGVSRTSSVRPGSGLRRPAGSGAISGRRPSTTVR